MTDTRGLVPSWSLRCLSAFKRGSGSLTPRRRAEEVAAQGTMCHGVAWCWPEAVVTRVGAVCDPGSGGDTAFLGLWPLKGSHGGLVGRLGLCHDLTLPLGAVGTAECLLQLGPRKDAPPQSSSALLPASPSPPRSS